MGASTQRRLRSEELLHGADVEGTRASSHDELLLGVLTVARVSSERGRVNALRSTSSAGMTAIEILSGLASQDLSGVVLIEHGDDGLAFCLEHSRVVGAEGTGKYGLLDTWCDTAPEQGVAAGTTWVELVQAFIERCVLDRLVLATRMGSNLTVVRGDVEWTGAKLDAADARVLSSLMVEHVRETDDASKYADQLHPLHRFAIPISAPGELLAQAAHGAVEIDSECSFAGLAQELDVARETKHDDMCVVWNLCTGDATLEELADRCLLGRPRTLAALHHLHEDGRIELGSVPPPPAPRQHHRPDPVRRATVDVEQLQAQFSNRALLREMIESFMGNMPGWIAELEGAAARCDRAEYSRLCGHIIGASGAVAARPLLQVAMAAQNEALEGGADLIEPLRMIEAAYATAFRELLSVHAGL